MTPKYIVESIEEMFIRCEDYDDATHSMFFRKEGVFQKVKEGDILGIDEKGDFVILEDETLERQEKIQKKFERLLKKGN